MFNLLIAIKRKPTKINSATVIELDSLIALEGTFATLLKEYYRIEM